MTIKVTYNKTTGGITLSNDVDLIDIETNDIQDSATELFFEIAVNTTAYEEAERGIDIEEVE
jgi:hypothetical protein